MHIYTYNDNREKLRLSTNLIEKTSFPQICKYIDYKVRGWGWEHWILPSLTWKSEGNIETVGGNSCKTRDQNIKQSKQRERDSYLALARWGWRWVVEQKTTMVIGYGERRDGDPEDKDIDSEIWEKYRIFRP